MAMTTIPWPFVTCVRISVCVLARDLSIYPRTIATICALYLPIPLKTRILLYIDDGGLSIDLYRAPAETEGWP